MSRRVVDLKYMTTITDNILRNKIMKEETLEMKKNNFQLIKQNTYDKKNKKNTIFESFFKTKEKQLTKEEPIQRIEKFGTGPKTKFTGTQPCRFCNNPSWNPLHECPASESNCINCGKKGNYARACRQRRQNNKGIVKKLTEETEDEPNESLSELDESIRHIEEMKNIEEKQTLHSENKTKRDAKRIRN